MEAIQSDGRPTLEEMYLRIAEVVATRSTCHRLKVGCVITNAEMTTVWSIGYNGNARGLPNGCTNPDQPGNCGCDLHAEINALIKAPYHEGDLVLFCTHTPCRACAKAIINSQVKKVFCGQAYRSLEGVELLRQAGIPVVIRDQ